MNQILDLREKRAKAWDAAKAFLDAHRGTDGMLSAEDSATYDRMEAEVINFGKEIERAERAHALEAEMNKTVNTILTGRPEATVEEKTGRASNAYKKAFNTMMRQRGVDHTVFNALQVGTDSEGGYLVPDEFERQLIDGLQDENVVRPLAHVITTSSGTHKIPVVTSHGSAAWTDEEHAYNVSDEAFGQTSLGAHKLTTMIVVSEELLNDSAFNMESYIAKEFGRRIGAAEEQAFLLGNGTGKPTGIIGTAGNTVTSGTANKISADDVIDLFYSLKAGYRRNAHFMCNEAIVKALRKLKTTDGQYLWQPSLVAGTPDTILGRPIITTSYMDDTVASTKDAMIFADFNYYWIADRTGRSFKRLNELYAATGQVAFLASERVDGKLILAEAASKLVIA